MLLTPWFLWPHHNSNRITGLALGCRIAIPFLLLWSLNRAQNARPRDQNPMEGPTVAHARLLCKCTPALKSA